MSEALEYARIVVREADAGRFDGPKTELLARALIAKSETSTRDSVIDECATTARNMFIVGSNAATCDAVANGILALKNAAPLPPKAATLVHNEPRNDVLEEAALAIENADTTLLDEIGAAYLVRTLKVTT